MSHSDQRGEPLPAALREWARSLLTVDHDHIVAARLGISRLAYVRALADLPVSAKTRDAIERAYRPTKGK